MDAVDLALIDFLSEFVTVERKMLIEKVLLKRTRHITPVLENIFQPQNASAVIRTCDCFGLQDLHVIENDNAYEVNPRVVHGASKWITLHRHNAEVNNTKNALNILRRKGYTIMGTVPDPSVKDIRESDFSRPVAVVFGTEATGLSGIARSMCDELVTYPMAGFTESMNISVSASLCMSTAVQQMNNSGVDGSLSELEKNELRLDWYRYSIGRSEVLEREFRKKMK